MRKIHRSTVVLAILFVSAHLFAAPPAAGPKTVLVPVTLTVAQQAKIKVIQAEFKVRRAAVYQQYKALRAEEAKAIADAMATAAPAK